MLKRKRRKKQSERESWKRDGLVQHLGPCKECGGILLRNFPEREEGTGDEKMLMMVLVLSNLDEKEEQDKVWRDAKVTCRKADRGVVKSWT